MLSGPNIDSLRSVITASRLSVVASGGVSTIDDVRKLKTLEPEGLKGMIIGKALYEGKIDLAEAVRVCKGTV
jgi:phosphoribosylformimino-5-aminoimidazole carboxamide ribotide isomerase